MKKIYLVDMNNQHLNNMKDNLMNNEKDKLIKPIDFKISKNKHILLLWSGGYDSTLILIEALRQGYSIETLYIDFENNFLKSKRELYKRAVIKNKLEDKFSNIIKDKIVNQTPIIKLVGTYFQPAVWLTQSLLNISNDKINYISLGYIRSSDFWHIHADWLTAFNSLQKCLMRSNIIEPLFPLEWLNKKGILSYFKYYYKEIYDLCHTCEMPIMSKGRIVDCGKCKCCKNFKENI